MTGAALVELTGLLIHNDDPNGQGQAWLCQSSLNSALSNVSSDVTKRDCQTQCDPVNHETNQTVQWC